MIVKLICYSPSLPQISNKDFSKLGHNYTSFAELILQEEPDLRDEKMDKYRYFIQISKNIQSLLVKIIACIKKILFDNLFNKFHI